MSGAAAYSVPAPASALSVPRLAAFIDDAMATSTLNAVFTARSLTPPAICEGGSSTALECIDAGDPPDVVVVDTGASESPAADLGILRSLLPEGVRVVALGSGNGVGEYRDIMAAGVSDYLVKPVSREALDDAIFGDGPAGPEASRSKRRAPSGAEATERQFVFMGARGGVGATTAAVNIAWLMAQRSEQTSLLLDMDLRFGTTLLALNLEPTTALAQMLQEPDRLDEVMLRQATHSVAPHLAVLAAEEPVELAPAVQPSASVVLLRQIRAVYRQVFIDLPTGRFEENEPYLAGASDVVLVSDVSLAGVRDTIRLLAQIERAAPEAQLHLLVGGISDPRKAPMSVRQFEESVGTAIAASIPHDPLAFGECSAAGRPLVSFRKSSKAAKAYNEFVQRFLPPPEKSGWRMFGSRRKEAG